MFRTSIKIGGGEGMKTKKARRSREINALLATKAAATQITCVRLVQELNAAQLWLATRFSNIAIMDCWQYCQGCIIVGNTQNIRFDQVGKTVSIEMG